jgi:hypothetical protein
LIEINDGGGAQAAPAIRDIRRDPPALVFVNGSKT